MADITFGLPSDRTALGLLTTPGNASHIQDGDVFSDDFLIRDAAGKVKCRWFSRVGAAWSGVRLWEPKLKDVSRLEAMRWCVVQRIKTTLLPAYKAAYNACIALGDGAWASFRTLGGDRHWIAYRVRKDKTEMSLVLSGDAPEKPENVEQGEAFSHTSRRLAIYNGFLASATSVLEAALSRKLGDGERGSSQTVRAVVNERTYWLRWDHVGGKYGYWRWCFFALPEDEIREVVL